MRLRCGHLKLTRRALHFGEYTLRLCAEAYDLKVGIRKRLYLLGVVRKKEAHRSGSGAVHPQSEQTFE